MTPLELLIYSPLYLLLAVDIALKIYGAYQAFKKKWYFGVAALLVPGFGLVVGCAKFFFKKDILK